MRAPSSSLSSTSKATLATRVMWLWPTFSRIPFRVLLKIRRKLQTFSTLLRQNLKIRLPQAMLWTRLHQLNSRAISWILSRSLVMDQPSSRPRNKSQSHRKMSKTRRRVAQTTSLSKLKMSFRLSNQAVTATKDSNLRLPSLKFARVLAPSVRSPARRTRATWVSRVLRTSHALFSAL